MNTQKVLLGALLAQPDLAPYSLPDLDVEHFAPDVQPVFAAVSGFWNSTGTLDAVQICERYPDLKTAVMGCFDEWSAECVRATRPNVEKWTQLVLEQAALTKFQSLAFQAGSSLTTFADLPDLYSKMGEALTLDREEQDFKPIGELVDNYVRKLNEKPKYIPSGIPVLDKHLHLAPGNLFIIGGRPSAGKTALSLQMACEQARRGLRVCSFSLETDPDTLTARIISNRLAVPLADVKSKTVPQSDLDSLADLHKLPLFIRSASGKGTGWIKAQAQRMKRTGYFHRLFAAANRQQGKRPIPANHQHFHRPTRTGTDHRNPCGSSGPAEPQRCTRIPQHRRSEGIRPAGGIVLFVGEMAEIWYNRAVKLSVFDKFTI